MMTPAMRPSSTPHSVAQGDDEPAWADTEMDDSAARHALALVLDEARAAPLPPPQAHSPTSHQRDALLQRVKSVRQAFILPWRDAVHLLLAALTGMGSAWLARSVYGYQMVGAVVGFIAGLVVLWGVPYLLQSLRARAKAPRSAHKKSGRPD